VPGCIAHRAVVALDSLAGEPAPSQRRVAIHERGDGLVEQYHGLLVDVDDCHSEGRVDDLCRRPANAWPAEMGRDEFAVGRWASHLTVCTCYVK
jgi:hypothetical protein